MAPRQEKTLARFRLLQAQKKAYFRDGTASICADNLRILWYSSLAAVFLIAFFLLITPFIIREWELTAYHTAFLPAAALFSLAVFLFRRRTNPGPRAVTALCLSFQGFIYLFVILLDTISSPQTPASFVPVMHIALPAMFAIPFWMSFSLCCAAEAIFIAAVLLIKDPFIGQYDIFSSLVGLLSAAAVTNFILFLRQRDFATRMRYRNISRHDALSGILNKQAFQQSMADWIEQESPCVTCTFFFMDLDQFKNINDTLGHHTGDQVLRIMGQILKETFRGSDLIGRFGGDEFTVLLKDSASRRLLEHKYYQIQNMLRSRTREETGAAITCSMGIVCAPEQPVRPELLFAQADHALYQAKRLGRARCFIVDYQTEKTAPGSMDTTTAPPAQPARSVPGPQA